MTMRSTPVALGFVGAVCAFAPGPTAGQVPADPRREMEGFAATLDAAVRRVSPPSPVLVASREGARGYRLPGFGMLFVLPPRGLPSPPLRSVAEREAARSLDDAIRHLEQGLRTASSPEIRAQMEKNLQVLRQTRAELRGTARNRAATVVVMPPPAAAVMAGEEIPAGELGPVRLEELQRQLETQMIEQMRALQEAEQSHGEQEREMARRMEEQLRELQARMEAVRRDVERARVEAERQVLRLAAPSAPAAAPAAPVPPAPPAPAIAPDAAVAPEAGAPPELPPFALGPAPWQMWFSIEEPADGRSAETIVRDVKTAVVGQLERQGAALPHLGPDEYVAVAVDFVPRAPLLGRRAQKTLVVKARKRDLDERRAGRIGADELRSRIEYAEY